MGEGDLGAAITERLHRLLRIHVLIAHEPARLIGADRQDAGEKLAVTLGVPLSISEEGAQQPVYRAKMMQGAPMAAAPTPIAQGEETLSVSVSVTWGIKQGQ